MNFARPNVFASWFNFPRLEAKTVGKLFDLSVWQFFHLPKTKIVNAQYCELPKTLHQNRWTFVLTSQTWRPKPMGSSLKFSRLKGRAVTKTQDQKFWAVVWISQDSRPKLLGICLNFQGLQTKTGEQLFKLLKTKSVGQFFELLKTKGVAQFFDFLKNRDQNCWAVVELPKTRRVLQFFELTKSRNQRRWAINWTHHESRPKMLAVVWFCQDQKCWAGVWTSQDLNCWVGVWTLNVLRLESKTDGQMFELPETRKKKR